MSEAGPLAGRAALVVGASSGIGKGLAARLATLGASVVVAARRAELLSAVAADMGAATSVVGDVRVEADCERIVTEAVAAVGPLDLVVYATGTSVLRPLAELTAADWQLVLETNLVGASLVARAAVPHLRDHAIVAFMSSETVGRPRHGLVAYAASKIALEEMARGWRVEHPYVRFAILGVGQTLGTDFARDFSMDAFTEVWPSWLAHGEMRAGHMDPDDLGACVAESLAVAVAHPGVDVERLVFRPPGPVVGLETNGPDTDPDASE
jgi:NAD(P)-dependent dehydrogenase (short-subunit alcohol dehydrogenase family)